MSADHDVRTRRRFAWDAVSLPLLKAMLCAVRPKDHQEIQAYDRAEACAWAVEAFGADPRRRDEPLVADAIDVLRKEWVPTLNAAGVADIVDRLERHHGAAPSVRWRASMP